MITGVAIKVNTQVFHLSKPNRHHHIIKLMSSESLKPVKGKQGFITNKGVFLNREDARSHALECKQVTKTDHARELFSEDLW